MSMADLHQALELIAANPGSAFFVGPRDDSLLRAAERALGGSLPATYRSFVSALGAGSVGSFEVYGVISDGFEVSSVPDAVWLTLENRKAANLPPGVVIVGSTGDGGYYFVELEAESPVFMHELGRPYGQSPIVAEDFGSFLLEGVRAEIDL